jgi:hypothetical protein
MEPFLIWRILTASLGADGVSGHRIIGVIRGGDQRPGQQDMSVPGARCGGDSSGPAQPGTSGFRVSQRGYRVIARRAGGQSHR